MAKKEMPSHEDFLIDLGDDSKKGPFARHRNLAIWYKGIEIAKVKFHDGEFGIEDRVRYPLVERHWKMFKAAYLMMKKEFMKLCGDTSAGIAVLDFVSSKLDRGQVSVLILFHNGKVIANPKAWQKLKPKPGRLVL